jgi:hypothetical protein
MAGAKNFFVDLGLGRAGWRAPIGPRRQGGGWRQRVAIRHPGGQQNSLLGFSEASAVPAHAFGCRHRFVADRWTSALVRFRNVGRFCNAIRFRNGFRNIGFRNGSWGFFDKGFCGCKPSLSHSGKIVVSAHFGGLVPL